MPDGLRESGLNSITLDADSTVKSVCGNQEGAAKGFNTTKKGAKSYHPLLVFISEMKLLYHTWFRTGSAYTSNGIVDFLKEVKTSLPKTIKEVFFRADSGFFSGGLFDLLESYSWDYLVKVKLKNLKKLLESKTWETIEGLEDVAICEFTYKAHGWGKPRTLKAIRSVKEYVEAEYLGEKQIVPVYQYACYISSYDMDALGLHELYKQRSTSEFCDERDQSKLVLNWRAKKQNLRSKTWIEQVKGQAMAGATLTDDFWANDILWQLSVFAFNISVMMRQKKSRFKRQEHRTFIDWFIAVPAKITKSGHQTEIKMYSLPQCGTGSPENRETSFLTKPTGKSLTGSSKRHKKRKEEKHGPQCKSIWARYVLLAHKMKITGHFMPKGQGMKIFLTGVIPNWP